MFTSLQDATPLNESEHKQLNNFFYSDFFPIIIGLLAIFCYKFDCALIGFCIVILFAIIIFITLEDVTPIIPLLMMVLSLFRTLDLFISIWIYIPCVLALFAIITHFILFPIKKLEKGKLYIPLIIVSVALFLGGIFSPYLYTYPLGLASRIATGPVMLIVYFFFSNYIKPPKGFDIKRYICLCLVIVGLVCSLELSIYNDLIELKDPSVNAHTIGWNNSNGVASIILLSIPAGFYLLIKDRALILHTLLIALLYLGLAISYSDGCLAIGIVSFPILCYFAFINVDNKMRPKLLIAFLCFLIAVLIALTKININEIIEKIKEQFISDHGRSELYLEAINHFINNPIFGIGFGYTPEDTTMFTSVIVAYNYHSTFFHVIATMGIVGLFAYIYYFVARYKILLKDFNAFNIFAYLSFSLMEVYGFIDCCEFNIMPLLIIATLLLIVVEKNNNTLKTLPLKALI